MKGNEKIFEHLTVVKRSGQRVGFNGPKIAIAIKKGFDDVCDDTDEKKVNKVYNKVLDTIEKEYADRKTIKIEDIQDIVEDALKKLKYEDVYESYKEYRERRKASREALFGNTDDDSSSGSTGEVKKHHKFMKAIESLGLKSAKEENAKRENANVDGESPMGTMLHFGSTVSKEFTKAYLLEKKFANAHDDGDIHIHDLDFMAMGTTTCMQINLEKLFKKGFCTGHGFLRTPNDIMSYSALAAIAIQSNQNDQHGGQSIPAFDHYLAPGVIKTFRKQLKQMIYDFLDLEGFIDFMKFKKIEKVINDLESINVDIETFYEFYEENERLEIIFEKAIEKAIAKTDKITFQAMEAFVHNLNTMHSRAGAQVPFSSINFGTDTSVEGRMVTKNYLLALEKGLGHGETPIFPISIFKVKEGVNYNEKDPNYDLFKLSCEVSAKRLFPNFSFLDAPFNKQFYKKGNFDTEVGYMGCRTRVMANVVDPDKAITPGRGNLSFTTINLPRLGIKYGILDDKKANMKAFYEELENKMELVKGQLLQRFDIQCGRSVANFKFLLGEGVWIDSENLKVNDRLRKVLKHGTLSIGFIGLAECLKALTGKHHAEDEKSEKLALDIIKFMRKKCDEFAKEYKLNFTLLATPAEGLSGRFTAIDRSIYGSIKGITDREYYTNSFHVPVYYKTNIEKKIKVEAPYHALTNAGHISYIELNGDTTKNVDAFMKIVKLMKESGIGYGAINHPVDRDPICGFTGIINDTCPGCARKEGDIPFERIRRITGYLVGTVDRFNNSKKAEVNDRVKHKL